MSLFEKLGQGGSQMTPEQQRQAMMQDVERIKANPASFIQARGYNIPGNMTDPREITQYLLRSGQIGGNRLQQVMQMIGMPARR